MKRKEILEQVTKDPLDALDFSGECARFKWLLAVPESIANKHARSSRPPDIDRVTRSRGRHFAVARVMILMQMPNGVHLKIGFGQCYIDGRRDFSAGTKESNEWPVLILRTISARVDP
jgi:hypothetical protein